MKDLTKRILALVSAAVLLLTFAMTLTGCDKEPTYSVEEYEKAFKLAYKLKYSGSTANMDEYELTDVFLIYGNYGISPGESETHYAPGEEFCTLEIWFRNYQEQVLTLELLNMPFNQESAEEFLAEFPSEAFRIIPGMVPGGYSCNMAQIEVEKLGKKDKIKLYKVCLDRCLQEYPDLMEQITAEE